MKCLWGLLVSFRNDLMGGNHLVGNWVTGKGMLEFLIPVRSEKDWRHTTLQWVTKWRCQEK